jgi:hypothetical protein
VFSAAAALFSVLYVPFMEMFLKVFYAFRGGRQYVKVFLEAARIVCGTMGKFKYLMVIVLQI